jgi:hypothetical protein
MFKAEDILQIWDSVESFNKDNNSGLPYTPQESEKADERTRYITRELSQIVKGDFGDSDLQKLLEGCK